MRLRYSALLAIGLLANSIVVAAPAHAAKRIIADWSMRSTAVMVDTAGGNDGKPRNVTAVPGVVGNGYHLDGSSSIVIVPSSDGLNPGRRDFKFMAYLRFDEPPRTGDYDPIRKGLHDSRGGDYKLELYPNLARTAAQAKCTFMGSTGSAYVQAGPNLADHLWHKVTCAKTATTIGLVIDGVSFMKTITVGSISNNAPFVIGAKYLHAGSATNWYKGDMDEVRFVVG